MNLIPKVEMTNTEAIKAINELLQKILQGDSNISINSLDPELFESAEIAELYKTITSLSEQQAAACHFAKALSEGKINQTPPSNIVFIDPLTELQWNLKHMVEQLNSLSGGDYNRILEPWGDLSDAFNKLNVALKEKQKLKETLKQKERQQQLIIDNSQDVFWILDLKSLTYKYISASITQMRGLTVEEAMDEPLNISLHGESYHKALENIRIALDKASKGLPTHTIDEYQQKCKDGRIIDIEINAGFINDEDGHPKEILGVTRDITRRKHAETALNLSQQQLKDLLEFQTHQNIKLSQQLNYVFENTLDAIAFFEFDNDAVYYSMYNSHWASNLHLNKNKTVNLNVLETEDEETVNIFKKYIHWIITENKAVEDVTTWHGRQMQLKVIPIKSNDGVITGCAAFVNDITEKHNALKKLQDLQKQLTYTGIMVETRERRKLASDLHDNVGPLLSSMNMYLSSLARKPEVEPYADLIKNVRRILKETIASVREISNNISPQVLNSYGLTAALNLFFETKQNLIEIKIENTLGDFRFSEAKEIMLYNIIKEAYNNSIKYAQASCIELYLHKKENLITVIFKDNGIGFNLEEKLASISQSMGLFSIINRIKNLEGIYDMQTSPGNGFYLEVNFLSEL